MMISYFRLKTIRYSTCLSAYRRKKIYTCQTSLSGVTMNIGSSSRFEHQEEEKGTTADFARVEYAFLRLSNERVF